VPVAIIFMTIHLDRL